MRVPLGSQRTLQPGWVGNSRDGGMKNLRRHQPPPTRAKDPSPGLLRRPPSPHGRGKKSLRAVAPNKALALSKGRGWTAPRAFTSRRGTGEGSFPSQPTVTTENVKLLLPPWQSRGIPQKIGLHGRGTARLPLVGRTAKLLLAKFPSGRYKAPRLMFRNIAIKSLNWTRRPS
jgi:hypothetical protein